MGEVLARVHTATTDDIDAVDTSDNAIGAQAQAGRGTPTSASHATRSSTSSPRLASARQKSPLTPAGSGVT